MIVITYMWNLKIKPNEKKQSKTHKYREQTEG